MHGNLRGPSKPIKCLAFLPHPTRQILASASNDSSIKIWNSETGVLVDTLGRHTKGVNFVAFTEWPITSILF